MKILQIKKYMNNILKRLKVLVDPGDLPYSVVKVPAIIKEINTMIKSITAK